MTLAAGWGRWCCPPRFKTWPGANAEDAKYFRSHEKALVALEKLQAALGLDDAVCADVKEIVDAGKFQLKADVADEALF